METNSNHSTNDGAKMAEKMLNDSTKQMTDFYTKQLNAATGFYKNLFDSLSTGNKEWNNNSFPNGFFNYDLTKAFNLPLNGMSNNFTNPFLPTFDKLYKQMADYNATMFSNLTNGLKSNTDLSEISKNYQAMVNTRIESSKNILKTATENYNKQLEFSVENSKKAIEEINDQFNVMVKQNQKFWSDLISSFQAPIIDGEKIVKDSNNTEIKKRTVTPTTELSDHKVQR